MTATHIVLTVKNGAPFLGEQIRSLQTQTHEDWRLWVRDDGSTDGTPELLEETSSLDARVHVFSSDGQTLGVPRGFSWLLERLPAEARAVFCCDADDVWLPEKIELSLRTLRTAEVEGPGPVLVHTDLTVTDAQLEPLDSSLWRHLGIRPQHTDLRRLLSQNVVTGPTILMNRELLDLVVPIPGVVPHHDWWIALVAAVFGRVVAIPESTVLYRRHGSNHTGVYTIGGLGWRKWGRAILRAPEQTGMLRSWLRATSGQAEIFLRRFEKDLPADARHLLAAYSEIPRLGLLRRKARVLKLRALPEHGLARNLALLLRA